MRKIALLAVSLSLLTLTAKATVLESRIMAVDEVAGDNEVFVMAEEEGRVLRADSRDAVLVSALKEAVVSGQTLRFDLNKKLGVIKGVLALETAKSDEQASCEKMDEVFVPTVFPSLDAATAAFKTMDSRTKTKSQCFNRAHGWSYDLARRGINTSKVFIFFTRGYIKKYNFDWWFHVAPYTLVNVDGVAVEHVLDRRFTNGPRDMRTWTNIFMKNDAFCPQVAKYTDYRNNQASQWCFLIKANMFYRSPMDLELLERDGREELGWNTAEVRTARKEAFKNWRDYNP